MVRRPNWLKILAVLHILEPLTKIVFYSLIQGSYPIQIIYSQINNSSLLYNIGFFFLFPAMGIAMLFPNKWALVMLIVSEFWVIISNLFSLPVFIGSGDVKQIVSISLFTTINLTVILLLIKPFIKLALTDRNMLWWRAFPRYLFEAQIKIDHNISGKIHDISESGIFISSADNLVLDKLVDVSFSHDNVDYKLKGTVKSFINKANLKGFGIEFNDNIENIKLIKKLIESFKMKKFHRSAEQEIISLYLPFSNQKANLNNGNEPTSFSTKNDYKESNRNYKKF